MKIYLNVSLFVIAVFYSAISFAQDNTSAKNNVSKLDSLNNVLIEKTNEIKTLQTNLTNEKKKYEKISAEFDKLKQSIESSSRTMLHQDSLLSKIDRLNNDLILKDSTILNLKNTIQKQKLSILDESKVQTMIIEGINNYLNERNIPTKLAIFFSIASLLLIVLLVLSLLQIHRTKRQKHVFLEKHEDLILKINDMEKSIDENIRKTIESTLISLKDFLNNLIIENSNSSLLVTNNDAINEVNERIKSIEKDITEKNLAITEYIEKLIETIMYLKEQGFNTNKESEAYKKELANSFNSLKSGYNSIKEDIQILKNKLFDISNITDKQNIEEKLAPPPESVSPNGLFQEIIEFKDNQFGISFNKHKIIGKGEDSDPILLIMKNQSSLIGVFDGLGGSGSRKYQVDGNEFTGAYISSRIVANSLANFFVSLSNKSLDFSKEYINDLKKYIVSSLKEEYAKYNVPESRIKSDLIQILPTTCASIYCDIQKDKINAHFLWAGDSRCFILTKLGLSQISLDDTKQQVDAYQSITNDPPMSNYISLSKDFKINHSEIQLESPVIFLSATDGAFNYIPVPYYLEYYILDSIYKASSLDEINALLIDKLKIAGDDVSLSIIGFGFSDINFLKKYFEKRFEHLRNNYYLPTEAILINESLSPDLFNVKINYTGGYALSINKLWQEYKKTYEKYFNV